MTTGFADQIRELPDDRLAALLRLRPDLVVPVPADLSALAARAQARVSVARALDTLDRFTLEILDALRLARVDGRADVDAVLALTAAAHPAPDPVTVRAALDRLRELFLVYGPEDELTVVPGVDEVTSPYPAGLGRPAAELDPAAAVLCADAAGLRRTVLAAPPPSRAVLDRLAAGPPIGSTTTGATADPDSAVGWLVERRLLVPTSETTVELPREVGLLLRRDDGPLGPLHPTPPEPEAPQRPLDAVDSAGAGQAMEVVRHTEELLDALSLEPAPVLKAGGLGVRDLRRLARLTGLAEAGTATVIEVAAAAGLLGETDGETGGEPAYLPTTGYDAWVPRWRSWPPTSRGTPRAPTRCSPYSGGGVHAGTTRPGTACVSRRSGRCSPRPPCWASPGWARSPGTGGPCSTSCCQPGDGIPTRIPWGYWVPPGRPDRAPWNCWTGSYRRRWTTYSSRPT